MDNALQTGATWDDLIRIVQLFIIPAIFYLARVLSKLSDRIDVLNNRVDSVEKDQVRTNTLLESRQAQRIEDRDEMKNMYKRFDAAITRLERHTERPGDATG